MLYLVATPIGNLSDMTFRAIETLKYCDYILCEDTRHSVILLKHYEIHKPLKSYHKFNEKEQLRTILEDLQNGKNIALISDAGTPGISDPGELLVKACVNESIPFTAIPGTCAAIQAISCSGLPTDRFQFYGFLPRKECEIRQALQEILSYKGTTICYESPNRLLDILNTIHTVDAKRELVVARELTKKFEELVRGTAQQILSRWKDQVVKGEIVLVVAGTSDEGNEWEKLSPVEHVQMLQDTYSLTKTEALKLAAKQRGVPKREIYKELI